MVPFVFVEHARVDVPTLYPALLDVSRLALCTVGNPFVSRQHAVASLGLSVK